MNNQRLTRSKSLLALEMSFIGLLAWVVFSSLIAWQSNTVLAGSAQQIQRPGAQGLPGAQGQPGAQGLPDGRFVPPEGPPPQSSRVPLAGTERVQQL